jgi:hypothetical protein
VQVTRTINEFDRLAKASQGIGLTVEQLSSLEFAAGLSGMGTEQLAASMGRLVRSMSDAARGVGTAKDAFARLGVEVQRADGTLRNSEEVLKDLADQLSGIENETERAGVGTQIFGRQWQAVAPLLNQGADGIAALQQEAAALGLVLSTETARAAELFNDNLTRLQSGVTGLWRGLTAELLPALVTVTEVLIDAQRQTNGFADTFDGAAERTINAVAFIADAIEGVRRVVLVLGRSWAVTILAMEREALRFANNIVNGPTAAVNGLIETLNRVPGVAIEFRAPAVASGLQQALQLAEGAVREGLADINEILLEPLPGDAIRAKFAEVSAALQETIGNARAQAPNWEDAIASPVERASGRAIAAISEMDRELQRLMDEGRRVYEQTRTPVEALAIEIERLNLLLEAGAITWDTYARAIFSAQEQFDATRERMAGIADQAEDATGEMSEFAVQAARNMQTAFADFLFDPFNSNLREMLRNFILTINRMVAELLAAKILQGFFTGLGFPNFGSLFGGARADGGPVSPGKAYVVGERGPELFIPSSAGRIEPNGGGSGGVRIINVIDPSLVGDYMAGPGGDRVVLNVLQRNQSSIRQLVLG